jgi:hypothetical protein
MKIPSKFDFRLNNNDFCKNNFAMSLKYENLCMEFLIDFYIAYLLKSFWKGHVLN